MKKYLKNVLIGIDQLVNTLANGAPDETISSRSWRTRRKHPWRRVLIDAIFFPIERNHCKKSWESERQHLQEPKSLRK